MCMSSARARALLLAAAATPSSSLSPEDTACQRIRSLFAPHSCVDFEQNVWEQTPHLVRKSMNVIVADAHNANDWNDSGNLLSMEALAEMIRRWQMRIAADHAQVVMLKPNSFLHDPRWPKQRAFSVPDVSKALGQGNTIVLHNVELYWPPISQLSLALNNYFHLYAQCNVYLSPQGLDVAVSAHQDAQSVFIIQIAGTKRWTLFQPPDKLMPAGAQRGKAGDVIPASQLGEVLLEAVLEPGDVLFIPRGTVHATSTSGAAASSLHLTVGIETETDGWLWGQVLSSAFNRTLGDEAAHAVDELALAYEELRAAVPRSARQTPVKIAGRTSSSNEECGAQAALLVGAIQERQQALRRPDVADVLNAVDAVLEDRRAFLAAKRGQLERFMGIAGDTEYVRLALGRQDAARKRRGR